MNRADSHRMDQRALTVMAAVANPSEVAVRVAVPLLPLFCRTTKALPWNALRCGALNDSVLVWLPLFTLAMKQLPPTSNRTRLSASGTKLPSVSIAPRSAVSHQPDIRRRTRRVDLPGQHLLPVFTGDGPDRSGGERYAPSDVKLLVLLSLCSEVLAVKEQFYLVGIVVVGLHVDLFTLGPVPMGKEVEHCFVRPFALVHVIGVFGESGKVDDAEIGAA